MISPLLRGTVFRRFWLGQTISLFGDQISLFAVPVTAVVLLHAHASQMGLLTAAGLLPSLLFSLSAGPSRGRPEYQPPDHHGDRLRRGACQRP